MLLPLSAGTSVSGFRVSKELRASVEPFRVQGLGLRFQVFGRVDFAGFEFLWLKLCWFWGVQGVSWPNAAGLSRAIPQTLKRRLKEPFFYLKGRLLPSLALKAETLERGFMIGGFGR